MAYIGFDLDETLGRFPGVEYPLFMMQPDIVYELQNKPINPQRVSSPFVASATLKATFKKNFRRFTALMAEKERGNSPNGLLRPGIIEIMKKLGTMKKEGKVKKMLIYSNNGNMGTLQFVSKMLDILTGHNNLFCTLVDWYDPLRDAEVIAGNPGAATKSLSVLKAAFKRCTREEIPDSSIYFFDDLYPEHPDLSSKLGDNYYRVNPYKIDADMTVGYECAYTVLKESGLIENEEYLQYLRHGVLVDISFEPSGYASFINRNITSFGPKKQPFIDDTAEILSFIDGIGSKSGGKRRRKTRKAHKKSKKMRRY